MKHVPGYDTCDLRMSRGEKECVLGKSYCWQTINIPLCLSVVIPSSGDFIRKMRLCNSFSTNIYLSPEKIVFITAEFKT